MQIDEVNALDLEAFVATFGHVYEDSPHLAAEVAIERPFADAGALVEAFAAVADRLDDEAGLALLQAHPQLGERTSMGASSRSEQRGAGLTVDDPVVERIRDGNRAYFDRFGFPFIIAVRGRTPPEIAAALETRLDHDAATERAEALRQVQEIARIRLAQVLG